MLSACGYRYRLIETKTSNKGKQNTASERERESEQVNSDENSYLMQ